MVLNRTAWFFHGLGSPTNDSRVFCPSKLTPRTPHRHVDRKEVVPNGTPGSESARVFVTFVPFYRTGSERRATGKAPSVDIESIWFNVPVNHGLPIFYNTPSRGHDARKKSYDRERQDPSAQEWAPLYWNWHRDALKSVMWCGVSRQKPRGNRAKRRTALA